MLLKCEIELEGSSLLRMWCIVVHVSIKAYIASIIAKIELRANITIYPEILMGIKFGGWVPNGCCKSIDLAIRCGIAIRIMRVRSLVDFYLAVVKPDYQTTKFSFPPTFLTTCILWYDT